MKRFTFLRAAGAVGAAFALPWRAAAAPAGEVIEVTENETATIDGRHWDTPIVGGRTIDAVHRSVLLRFPGAADAVALVLGSGRLLANAELVLRYDGYEIVPEGYLCRDGLGRKVWTEDPPTWHIQAWPLRQPWMADPATGPTFNASVNGRRHWGRYGASDPARDRHEGLLEPREMSSRRREARFDITRLLATDALAADAGRRLLALEQSGFLLRKVETYDARYRLPGDSYEWAMPTGGHGLRFASPSLVLSFRPLAGGRAVAVALPARLDRKGLLTGDGSRATAVLPAPTETAPRARRVLEDGLKGRPAWQIERIRELLAVGGDRASPWLDTDHKTYLAQLKEVLATPPRYWQGWSVQEDLLTWFVFRDLLPAPVRDHLLAYWRAWLQPDLPTEAFFHPTSREALDDYRRTHDWRGHASFFRDGYNFAVSTQNFNHTAAMGALLGGAMIDAGYAIADGRHGLESLPLRYWGFLDGSTQEILDHYYLSITLSGQKMIADFAPAPIDRLMGRVLVDRTMEMLVSLWHPRLRCVSSSGRARISGVLVEQDGIYGALHTLSKAGAVNYLGTPSTATAAGMPVWGYDFPAGRVAVQSLPSPWAPSWIAGLVDDKPVPFEETSVETVRNTFKPPLWRRAWLGRWHGLASTDIRASTVAVMGQWVREAKTATRLEDLGTLTARYVANGPDLTTTQGGGIPQAGLTLVFQSRNRAIVFAKPHSWRERFLGALGGTTVTRLATVIGLWTFATPRSWEIYAGDRRIETFPAHLPAGQRILIHDGVTYLAILPLPASDLGRDAEIEIAPGLAGKAEPNGAAVAPVLTISIFNFKREQAVAARELDLDAITTRAHGGFVLEMGDADQHGSFAAFARHIAQAELTARWDGGRRQLDVAYKSGGDLMEAGFTTNFKEPTEDHFPIEPGQQEHAIPYRRLNGGWPYLPAGLERDTTWAQQGTTGRLEKNGAVLVGEPGRKSYILADPLSGAVVGYNPLPDLQAFSLSTRDGVVLRAEGTVGLMRVEYRPWARECDISHVLKAGQDVPGVAKSFTISGLAEPPKVTVNGRPAEMLATGQSYKISLA